MEGESSMLRRQPGRLKRSYRVRVCGSNYPERNGAGWLSDCSASGLNTIRADYQVIVVAPNNYPGSRKEDL